jgi:SAM-dependent methyltransferase
MQQTGTRALSARKLLDANRLYYDSLWSGAQLVEPDRFNTWPLVQTLLPRGGRRLEVAPGLRPRLPLEGTQFVDVSGPALAKLARRGASVVGALITSLPFADASFDLVCALDIVEHVDDDAAALEELSRVARPGAAVLLSVPLHPELWNAFDDFVGHRRRYRPECWRTPWPPRSHDRATAPRTACSRVPRGCSIRHVVSHPPTRARALVVQPRVHADRAQVPEKARLRDGAHRHARRRRDPDDLPQILAPLSADTDSRSHPLSGPQWRRS